MPEETKDEQETPGISDGLKLFLFTVALPAGTWVWVEFFQWLF